MLIPENYVYTFIDPEFYETLDRYAPDRGDYIELVSRMVPGTWRNARRGVWYYASPAVAELPQEGWKIHLSATLANAAPILAAAARLLAAEETPFKFLLDRRMLIASNSKRWPRGSAGKFVTIYPRDVEHCRQLLERLYTALIGYEGPYILSDRRYRDCTVLYYRYGGIMPSQVLDVYGKARQYIARGDGSKIPDEREAYFVLPDGIADPFAETSGASDEQEPGTLHGGRYRIDQVLTFTTSGGVFKATDRQTGQTVVVKEARPHTNFTATVVDAVAQRKKELRLLSLFASYGLAPRPLGFFKDWEHSYLVQEFVDGMVLRVYAGIITPALRVNLTRTDKEAFYSAYRALVLAITNALAVLHAHGVTFSDLSHFNVMVSPDGGRVWLIDFEGAHESGVEAPTAMFTPGFAPVQMMAERAATAADDIYALGCLMLAVILPYTAMAAIDPQAHRRFLASFADDFNLPPAVTACIAAMTDADRAKRPTLAEIGMVLTQATELADEPTRVEPERACVDDALVGHILSYVESTAAYERDDRLFPADPAVFESNPLSVAYGACGVAVVQAEVRGAVSAEVLRWILRQPISGDRYPPGLYVGTAGIAWSLWELGAREEATALMRATHDATTLWKNPDLFYGVAGWGLADLKFFTYTGDDYFLGMAEAAGEHLVATRSTDGNRCWWSSLGHQSNGIAHGGSGSALFLLYLHKVTNRDIFLDIGRAALEHVMTNAIRTEQGFATWRATDTAPTLTSYWRWGSAGIGMALLRYWHVLRDERLASMLRELWPDVGRKYSIFPGRFFGLSGMGEFFLDAEAFSFDGEAARDALRRTIEGVSLYAIGRPCGIAFPGETRFRISCDYGTGGAGIASFLHRCIHRTPALYMLDELLLASERQIVREPVADAWEPAARLHAVS